MFATFLFVIVFSSYCYIFTPTRLITEEVVTTESIADETLAMKHMKFAKLYGRKLTAEDFSMRVQPIIHATPKPAIAVDYSSMTVAQLRKIAQSRHIKGARNMNKSNLLEALS